MDTFDVTAVERAEASLDAFINSRSRDKKRANEQEELWAALERRVREKRSHELQQAWIDHHGHMSVLHTDLALEHADKRARLMLEAGYDQDLDQDRDHEPDEGPEAA